MLISSVVRNLRIMEMLFIAVWGKIGLAVVVMRAAMKFVAGHSQDPIGILEFLASSLSPMFMLLAALPAAIGGFNRNMSTKSLKHGVLERMSLLPFFHTFTTFEVEYVSSFSALSSEPVLQEGSLRSYGISSQLAEDLRAGEAKNLMIFITVLGLGMFLYAGPIYIIAIPFGMVVHWTIAGKDVDEDWKTEVVKMDKFNGTDGIYRVTKSFFGFQTIRGVATVNKGVLQTRMHVVDGRPADMFYQGRLMRPAMYNHHLDLISWGGNATYITPEDGQEVVVELLPTHSDATILYSSECMRLSSGEIVFKGVQTLGGVSGSPFFIKSVSVDPVDGEQSEVVRFAGNLGTNFSNNYDDKFGDVKWQVELLRSGGNTYPKNVMDVLPGGNYQVFDYPGSGKTRSDIPAIVKEGLRFCPNVIIAGPTRVVAREIFTALSAANKSISLNIRGSIHRRRTARIIVTTHSSFIRMIACNDPVLRPSSGVILDEAHFDNSHTRMLLSYFRNLYSYGRREGFYVEMTATGYDFVKKQIVINKGSRHQIADIPYLNVDSAVDEVIEQYPGKRILIFAPQVTGSRNSVEWFVKMLIRKEVHQKIVPMYRAVYEQAVKTINQHYPEGLIIVSTSISECGANYDVDVVIDTCKRLAYVQADEGVPIFRMQEIPIRLSQVIQRRGRVGRRREGFYYYPQAFEWQTMQEEKTYREAEDDDEAVFQDHMMFHDREGNRPSSGVSLTKAQLIAWLRGENHRACNARTIALFFKANGTLYSKDQVFMNFRKDLLKADGKEININGRNIRVAWWDDRDASILCRYLANMNLCNKYQTARLWTKLTTYAEYRAKTFVYEHAVGDGADNRNQIVVEGIPLLRRLLPQYVEDNPQDDVG